MTSVLAADGAGTETARRVRSARGRDRDVLQPDGRMTAAEGRAPNPVMSGAPSEDPLRARARRGLAIYFALVLLGSGTIEGIMIARGLPITSMLGLALANMWVPGIASVITRLVTREGFGDVAFGLRGRHGLRELAIAWLYPLPVAFLGYGVAWASGLATFRAPHPTGSVAGDALGFVSSLGIVLTLGTVLSAISAAGEEIGWRGYMVTRLVDAGVPRPLLVSGVVWGLWHVPLILSGQYAAGPLPALSALLFVAGIIPEAYLAARVRVASGSIWPAVALHASWNAVVQGPFDGYTAAGNAARTDSIWIGESGILVVVASVLVAGVITWRPFAFRRTPREEPSRMLSMRDA